MDTKTADPKALEEAKRRLLEKRLRGEVKPQGAAGRIRRHPGGPVYPMSFNQERLWFLDQLEPGNPMYNIGSAIKVSARIDVPVLERAFGEVVRRHEGLRTVFRLVDGRPSQIVVAPYPVRIPVEDLRGPGGEPASDATIRARIAKQAATSLDLANGPLVTASLFRVSEDDYVLFFVVHHIVTDGWAMPIFTREVEQLYDAFSKGKPSPLEELEISYADYSVWQREWLKGPVLERQLDYWRRHLEGAPHVLDLPTDHPRPAVQRHKGELYRCVYSFALGERLRALGKEEQASLNMVFMAGFELLMHRYSGQDDVIVGTLAGNRNRSELETVVGFFVNSVPVRSTFRGDPTFRELVRQTREAVLGADAHQETPFDMIVEAVDAERDTSRNAVFQVMFFHHTFVGMHHLADDTFVSELNVRSIYDEADVVLADTGTAQFDLSIATLEMADSVPVMTEWNTDLWDRDTIVRLVEHMRVLLEAAVENPDVPVSRLPMITPAEREEALARSRAVPVEAPAALHAAFEARAAERPRAVALVSASGDSMTYADLDARAGRLAARLRAAGVGPETRVGVCIERSPELVVSLFAVLKAGGCYVPLDPEYPAERLAYMLEDSGAAVVVARGALPASLSGFRGPVIDVSSDDSSSGDAISTEVDPAGAAYVIYTSGSTGRPKGVLVQHGEAAAHLRAAAEAYGLTAEDRVFAFVSPGFDVSVEQLLAPLSVGASVRLRGAEIPAPREMVELVHREGITMLDPPTAYWHQLVADDAARDALKAAVRLVLVGGESMGPAPAAAWVAAPGRARLLNGYGPTEAVVTCSAFEVPAGFGQHEPRVPIGTALAGRSLHVVGPDGEPQPVGVPGELCVGGLLARGYLNRPGATAAAFVPDPFSGTAGARMYRTGDRARLLKSGDVEFLGRLDEQVKVRGFRIEPGEVEAALCALPGVADAAVLAREVASGDLRLVAYVVGRDGASLETERLSEQLRTVLPAYMVPQIFVPLPALPMNANGKVDRAALPTPEPPRAEGRVAPRSEIEEKLARVWADVLGTGSVGVHDNFFTLGGDSILSIQVVSRAAREGLRITPKDMFAHQTVAELAAVAAPAASSAADAEQGEVTGAAPLTPVQRWFFEEGPAEPHHYNLSAVFEVAASVEPAHVEGAAAAVIAHHDALRMRFRRTADGWTQENAAVSTDTPFEAIDLSPVPADRQEAAFAERAAAVQASLSLENGPVARFALFDFGPNRPKRLLAIVHHLVTDAVSWGVLAEDLESALAQTARGEKVLLPPKTTSFRRWAERLAEHARGDGTRGEMGFWLAQGGTSPLPADGRIDGRPTEADAERLEVSLDVETTRALLTDVPPVYGTQANDVLLAALARAFRRWTGERALLVDLEGHGREELFEGVDLSRTVGWFTTVFPVRLELPEDDAPGETLKGVKERLRSIPRKGIGYGLLRHGGDPETAAALAALPQAQVSFNYLGQLDAGAGAGSTPQRVLSSAEGVDPGPQRSPRMPLSHPLALDAAVAGGRLHVTWTFAPRLHSRETVQRLADGYLQALGELVEHCRHPEAGGFTPSDFALADLDQQGLDALLAELGR